MRKKLALCIPTYNRGENIEQLLQSLPGMDNENFAVYIFDSSEDEKTKILVENYARKHIYYELVEGVEYSNQKVFRIYERMADSEADYVWLMNDHSIFDRDALEFIFKALEEDGDFYLLDVRCPEFSVTDFAGLDDFLVRSAWQLTYWGASIVKRETFLKGVDWSLMDRKYLVPETMEYSQLGFYFERSSQLPDVKLKQIGLLRDCMMDRMRYEKPAWHKEKFRICTQCWHEVIMRLPDVYKVRTETLKSMDSWYLSKFSLMELKEDGAYGLGHFLRYGKYLSEIAPERYREAFLIAMLPLCVCRQLLTGNLLRMIKSARQEQRKIYVYGAGRHGVDCTNYLESCGIIHDGFLVTDLVGNPQCIRDYPVYASEEKLEAGILVILAFLSEGKSSVEMKLETLRENGMDIKYMAFNA